MTYVGAVPTTGDFKLLDSITTSSSTTFNLRQGGVAVYPQSANHCIVQLNGVNQVPGSSFNIVNDTIVFASSLASSDVINQILVLGNVNDIGVVSDDTISTAKLQANAVNASKLSSTAVDNTNTNSTLITAQTEKTSLVDADKFLISDSAASGALKYVQKSNLPSGSLTKVGSSTTLRSSHGDADIPSCFSTTYDAYLITWAITNDRDGNEVRFRFVKSDGSTQNSDYSYHNFGYPSNSTSISQHNASGAATNQLSGSCMGSTSSIMWSSWGSMWVYRPMGTAEFKPYAYNGSWYDTSGYPVPQSGGGRNGQTTAFTGIRFLPSANYFFTSDIHVYGLET